MKSASDPAAPIRTSAFVLRRTNYGEADRILNLITPVGKQAVIAKSVRREKSRLAGGIELFCLSEVVIHPSRHTVISSNLITDASGHSKLVTNPQKPSLGILTGAKMLKCYQNLTHDLDALELASKFLKQIDRSSEQITTPDHFDLIKQTFEYLNGNSSNFLDSKKSIGNSSRTKTSSIAQNFSATEPPSRPLATAWFTLNLARISGEEPNLYTDATGQPLRPTETYLWDDYESALRPDPAGPISTNEIKFLRLLLTSPLSVAARVQTFSPLLDHSAELLRYLS